MFHATRTVTKHCEYPGAVLGQNICLSWRLIMISYGIRDCHSIIKFGKFSKVGKELGTQL